MVKIGYCISAHGLGHASRSLAVMEALKKQAVVKFEILTTVPAQFFTDQLPADCRIHHLPSDVGLVQRSSMEEDIPATLKALEAFYPLDPRLVQEAVRIFKDCACVFSDIAPLGIVAARELGIPSVLVENFTWDWIYQGYLGQWPLFDRYISILQEIYQGVDYRIQAAPFCERINTALRVEPIARPIKPGLLQIRKRLSVGEEQRLILITMGGVPGKTLDLSPLQQVKDTVFVLAGGKGEISFQKNICFLPMHSDFYHPNLVAAADGVVGKVGYSTLAEISQAGTPFIYIRRKMFRESEALVTYIRQNLKSWEITEQELLAGSWLSLLTAVPLRKKRRKKSINGADQVAAFVCSCITGAGDDRPRLDLLGVGK